MIFFRYFSRHKQNPRKELISDSHFLTSQMQKRLRLSVFFNQHAIVAHFFIPPLKRWHFSQQVESSEKIQSIVGGQSLTHTFHITPQSLGRHYWEISWLHLQQGRFTFAINHRPGKMSKHCTNVHAIHKLSCRDFGLYTNNNKKIKTTTNIWRVQPACSSHL